ncbi:MAG: hypothetical protein ACE5FT_03550 [Candidatus Nanoarchaeia archaeon]
MSYVNVMIVKSERVYFASLHYRQVKRLLEDNLAMKAYLAGHDGKYLDAGYMLVDFDRGEVISRQVAIGPVECPLLWLENV